jgi:hypothetical protein
VAPLRPRALPPNSLPPAAEQLTSGPKLTTPQHNLQGDPVEQLRTLGELRQAGLLSDEEFEAKKAELLGRI